MSSVPPPQFPIRTNINAPPTCIFITPEMPARVRSIFYPIPPQPNQHPGIAAGEDQCFYCGHFGHRQERCNDAKLKKPRSAEDFEDWRRVSANPKWYSVTALWPSCAPRPRRDNTPETALTSTKAFVSALNDTSKYFDSKRYSKLLVAEVPSSFVEIRVWKFGRLQSIRLIRTPRANRMYPYHRDRNVLRTPPKEVLAPSRDATSVLKMFDVLNMFGLGVTIAEIASAFLGFGILSILFGLE
ncbi:uncharacterized protein MELLADRAFT_104555 [Melampsora larici-populina 98AG31]|uniref:CCHC-type domain-containing protein n=1 Tax=Melampsora larici-populina (strain 98AG31 / pathotype 3-4-7) TaxID=747676 RepID=F4RF36_MELLP|nr:uncharacterized protein MELLADRAFT_104555 [Melampsora larici-populina 98AG31]EGG08748.1 hypothetical protein MELLADRAFT_104555 [Melampsora larici-populina 98AG31]